MPVGSDGVEESFEGGLRTAVTVAARVGEHLTRMREQQAEQARAWEQQDTGHAMERITMQVHDHYGIDARQPDAAAEAHQRTALERHQHSVTRGWPGRAAARFVAACAIIRAWPNRPA